VLTGCQPIPVSEESTDLPPTSEPTPDEEANLRELMQLEKLIL